MKNKLTKLAILFGLLLISAHSIYSQTLPPGFVIEQVAPSTNLVSMAFAPDGRIFVAEQSGTLKLLNTLTQSFENILTVDSVFSQKEKGLLGIAFDPNFTTNGYIYLYYTINVRGNLYNGVAIAGTQTDPPIRHKIARYTMSANTVVSGSKRTVLDLDITTGFATNFNHDGGIMRFGIDGKLYVATGEGDLWCNKKCMSYTQNNCNCGNLGWQQASWAHDNNSFQGKILRMNADGTAPNDNPFFNSPTPVQYEQKYFYAKGFRNPFTMNFKPGTNELYINDVGSSGSGRREEINKLSPTTKKHFGWQAPGGGEGILNNVNYEDPVFAYLSGNTTSTGCGIVGGAFYQTSTGNNMNWPRKYHNKYFYMDFCNGYINTLDFENNKQMRNFARGINTNFNNVNSGFGILNLENSPDGNMHFIVRSLVTSLSGLYKISYAPAITTSGINITSVADIISVVGGTLQMSYNTIPSNATNQDINWFTEPSSIATINQNGVLSALNNGTVTVIGISDENGSVIGKKVISLANQLPPTSIIISTSGYNFLINTNNGTINLGYSIIPSNANPSVSWSILSSNPSHATASISTNGTLTATGSNGFVTAKVSSNVNPAIFSTVVITLTGQIVPLSNLQITSSGENVITTNKGTIQLTPVFIPTFATNQEIEWSVDDESIASISGNGLVSAVSNGIATIYATSIENNLIIASYSITISGQLNTSIIIKNNTFSEKNLIVYPNPNSGIFNIELDLVKGKDITVYVMDQLGNDIYKQDIKNFSGKTQMNLSNIAKGMYRVSVSHGLGSYHQVILIY